MLQAPSNDWRRYKDDQWWLETETLQEGYQYQMIGLQGSINQRNSVQQQGKILDQNNNKEILDQNNNKEIP